MPMYRQSAVINVNRYSERRVCLIPCPLISPIVIVLCPINHGVERRVVFTSIENVFGFLMHFPTYRVSIRSRCRYQEKQRLFSRVARAVGHDIIQGTVRLRMEFVENDAVNIQSVLGILFSADNTGRSCSTAHTQAAFATSRALSAFLCRALFHHLASDIKNDGGLLSVCRTAYTSAPHSPSPANR